MYRDQSVSWRALAAMGACVIVVGLVGACECKRCKTVSTTTETIAPTEYRTTAEYRSTTTPPPPVISKPARVTALAEAGLDMETAIENWPAASKAVAHEIAARYGPPNSVMRNRLLWRYTEPWKEIIVMRDGRPHEFPTSHLDVLEQVIELPVPSDKLDELAAFRGRVTVDRANGTLSATCENEAMNILALNLAHDIITGAKTPTEANDLFSDLAMDIRAGKTQAYTRELQFEVRPRADMP